jgi:ABC-type lipoprotein export system ATPase subunit
MNWPKGSKWRKWDLHVHSPASHAFSGDWNQFIIQIGNADCDVIGINDYFSVAGYKEVRRLLADPGAAAHGNKPYREALEKLQRKTLLPVVECRMNNIVVGKKGSGPRINFHLIFDPDLPVDDIETFIKGLKVDGTSIGSRYNDAKFLLDDVSVNFGETCQALKNDGAFAERFLIWIPYDEYGGIDAINPATDRLLKEGFVRSADILGSSNRAQADFFLWKDAKFTEDQFREWFGRRKPCIKGSDSHNVNDELGKLRDHNSQPVEKYCWIKADPTFSGLRQIINEPEDRVYVGRIPPKLHEVQSNTTRYVSEVRIGKTPEADTVEAWFDCAIPLNFDMVAIIGNKGSGKSALADILALAGNTHCDPGYFSFLTKDRFCEKNGRLAKQFTVEAVWKSTATSGTLGLHEKPDPNRVELVKYIPQKYLEKVCTETEPGQKSEFQSELRKVIFSHIGDADRLDKESLDELIQYKTEEITDQLAVFRQDISKLNIEIVRLEGKATVEHTAQIESKRKQKQAELDAHIASQPPAAEKPSDPTPEQQEALTAITGDLGKERTVLAEIEAEIATQQGKQKTLAEQIALARKLEGRVDNFSAEHQRLRDDTAGDFGKLGLDFDAIVALTIDKKALTERRDTLVAEKDLVDAALMESVEAGLPQKKAGCLSRIKALQDKLDAPNRLYQAYHEALKLWEQQKQLIEGDADKPETLRYYEAQLKYISEELPAEISAAHGQRAELARRIHQSIASVRDIYEELFAPVQHLIQDSIIIKEGFKLTFDSSIKERTFERDFFETYINQGVAGSFCGKDKGAAVMEGIRADYDFNRAEDAVAFVENVMRHLEHDMRVKPAPMSAASQLRKHVELTQLYDYLWSFAYLEPEYSLKLDGKELGHLSPGERGTLLLVFYLLVDKSNQPIIVDQPEENLDSQTVFRLLIPVIKEVKKRRQIIMVTHSPNIAVVCDAEQIIHANIDRANGNAVVYTAGSIESPVINKFLVDVLEGTRPAFDNREAKYYV